MNQIFNAIAAAAAILGKAAAFAKAFVTANTPESATLAAIALAYQQYTAGAINGTQFATAAIAALIAFAVAEANKDKANP